MKFWTNLAQDIRFLRPLWSGYDREKRSLRPSLAPRLSRILRPSFSSMQACVLWWQASRYEQCGCHRMRVHFRRGCIEHGALYGDTCAQRRRRFSCAPNAWPNWLGAHKWQIGFGPLKVGFLPTILLRALRATALGAEGEVRQWTQRQKTTWMPRWTP